MLTTWGIPWREEGWVSPSMTFASGETCSRTSQICTTTEPFCRWMQRLRRTLWQHWGYHSWTHVLYKYSKTHCLQRKAIDFSAADLHVTTCGGYIWSVHRVTFASSCYSLWCRWETADQCAILCSAFFFLLLNRQRKNSTGNASHHILLWWMCWPRPCTSCLQQLTVSLCLLLQLTTHTVELFHRLYRVCDRL